MWVDMWVGGTGFNRKILIKLQLSCMYRLPTSPKKIAYSLNSAESVQQKDSKILQSV
jgi:hypothetical protein